MLAKAPDEELLARLLGRPIAGTNRLGDLLDGDASVLARLGLTEREAEVLQVVAEIARRHQPQSTCASIHDPEDVVASLLSLRRATRSQLVAVVGDRNGYYAAPITIAAVSEGCACRDLVRLSRLDCEAGSAVILAHNHTWQCVAPTERDLTFTAHFARLCRSKGIDFVDHIIVSGRDWISLRRRRVLD